MVVRSYTFKKSSSSLSNKQKLTTILKECSVQMQSSDLIVLHNALMTQQLQQQKKNHFVQEEIKNNRKNKRECLANWDYDTLASSSSSSRTTNRSLKLTNKSTKINFLKTSDFFYDCNVAASTLSTKLKKLNNKKKKKTSSQSNRHRNYKSNVSSCYRSSSSSFTKSSSSQSSKRLLCKKFKSKYIKLQAQRQNKDSKCTYKHYDLYLLSKNNIEQCRQSTRATSFVNLKQFESSDKNIILETSKQKQHELHLLAESNDRLKRHESILRAIINLTSEQQQRQYVNDTNNQTYQTTIFEPRYSSSPIGKFQKTSTPTKNGDSSIVQNNQMPEKISFENPSRLNFLYSTSTENKSTNLFTITANNTTTTNYSTSLNNNQNNNNSEHTKEHLYQNAWYFDNNQLASNTSTPKVRRKSKMPNLQNGTTLINLSSSSAFSQKEHTYQNLNYIVQPKMARKLNSFSTTVLSNASTVNSIIKCCMLPLKNLMHYKTIKRCLKKL
jgi:hypothetical protein